MGSYDDAFGLFVVYLYFSNLHIINFQMNLIEKTLYYFLLTSIVVVGITSCQTPINEQEEPPKEPKTVGELIEESNKEFLIREYDIQLKVHEIEFYLNEAVKTNPRMPNKEWMNELIYDVYYERKDNFALKIKEANTKPDKFKANLDSLIHLNLISDETKTFLEEGVEQLKTLIKDNQQYLESVN